MGIQPTPSKKSKHQVCGTYICVLMAVAIGLDQLLGTLQLQILRKNKTKKPKWISKHYLLSVYHPVNPDLSEAALYETSNKKKQTEHIILTSLPETSLRPTFYETWWLARNKWALVIIVK